jgi:fimbrial chaperone protein
MEGKAPRGWLVAILVTFASADIGAFTMEPMMALLVPSGMGSVATFRIKNDGPDRVAVRFRVVPRDVGSEGQEVNGAAEGLFVVYPSRLLVEPGSVGAVKVQWKGSADLDLEKSYRFIAEQVPIDASAARSGASGFKIMFRYIASLYVGDAAFACDLAATVTGALGANGEPGYAVEIRNAGKRHVVATDVRIESGEEGALQLSGEELGGLSGANYLPLTSRKAFIPRPEASVGTTYAAKIIYEKAY